jgi:hypothetical protein
MKRQIFRTNPPWGDRLTMVLEARRGAPFGNIEGRGARENSLKTSRPTFPSVDDRIIAI